MYAVETLGACDVICSDKTGTITQNKMKVEDFYTFFSKKSEKFEMFLNSMVLCNDSKKGEKGFVGASTEIALVEFAKKNNVDKTVSDEKYERISEKAFSSHRKMMSTLNRVNGENVCFVKGALDRVLAHCEFYLDDEGLKPLDENVRKKINEINKSFCEKALRVLSFAFKRQTSSQNLEEENLVFLGLCGLQDPPRKEIESAVKKCKQAGMRPVMITGDYKDTAFAIAKKVGIAKDFSEVLSGEDIDKFSDEEFAKIVENKSVFAVNAVEEGRKIYSNIQKTIKYLFSANMAEILALFFITILFPGMTFLLPVQILFVNLITDSLPAIALGTEPVESELMFEKPRKKGEGLFGAGMGISLLVLGTVQTILTLGAYLFGLFVHNEMIAITMAFYTLNLIQLFYMFTARTKESCFKSNPFKNKFFNFSLIFGFGLILLLAFTGFGNLLQLQKLNFSCWLVVLVLSVSIIFVGELYKLIEKKIKKRR